jgi:hypothetical protein
MTAEEQALFDDGIRVADAIVAGLVDAAASRLFAPGALVAGATVALQRLVKSTTDAGHDLGLVNITVERILATLDLTSPAFKGTKQ